MAVYLQYITDYTYGTGKKKCNNIPTPILPFSLPHCFPWWKPRALVCGTAGMQQNYSKANTFLLPSTLPSTVEIQGPLCAEVMACHNISTPLRTYVVVAFPSALFRTSICFVHVRDTAYARQGSLSFPHGCVPFRSVPFHSAVFRSIPLCSASAPRTLFVYPISSVFSSIARKMHRFADRVPVRTEGSGTRYDGRVWYELLSCISSVNGKPVDRSRSLEKSVLHQGDQVTMEYQNRTYHGVVDMPSDSESEGQESHSTSPLHMPLSPEMRTGAHLSCEPERTAGVMPRAELEQLTPKVNERRSPRKRRPSQLLLYRHRPPHSLIHLLHVDNIS